MERRYNAKLVIKGHRSHDHFYSDLKVNLHRPYTDENKTNEYNFHELIVDYKDMDESTAARIRDYIVFHLFTWEEIGELKTQLTDSGDGELEYSEIKLPIRFEAENTIFFSGGLNNPLPGLFSHYDSQQCDYFFEKSGVCGHFDLHDFEVFKRQDFKDREEKMKWPKQVINDFDRKIDVFISNMLSYIAMEKHK